MSKTKIFLISTGVLVALAIVTGISYALWLINSSQTNENIVTSECFDITFTEDTSSNINLQTAFPMIDSDGMSTTPYTFSVENTCDTNAAYQINVEVLNTTTLSHDLIKTAVDQKTPSIVTDKSVTNATIANATSYSLETFYLAPNDINNHEFRMWIDEAGTLDNAQNKTISAKIVVSAVPIDELPYDVNLESPVLDSKMVAVTIADNGTVKVADTNTEWYNYANSEWANAVIVDPTFTTLDPGTTIPMESIEQMYVWIPRYEYKKSSIVNAQESIEINFVPISKVNTDIENNDVIVHSAFTFGGVEQAGLWIGKFEMGFNDGESETTANVEYIIKPNVNSVHNTNISTMFDKINNAMTTYSLDSATDVHMMKNTEWGAVAYLSQSKYGICEDDVSCSVKIENNNYWSGQTSGLNGYDIVTGCGGNDTAVTNNVTGIEICPASNRWETANGIKASTTHNITGIYDMAGGRQEYVMGNMQDSSGNFYSRDSGFITAPDAKYYDSYVNGSSQTDYTRGLYGDATIELNPSGTDMYNWNGDFAGLVSSSSSWFLRGGFPYFISRAGVWSFSHYLGFAYSAASARSVVSFAQ